MYETPPPLTYMGLVPPTFILLLCLLQGVAFLIQSDKYSAAHLALQVELFVQDTLKRIETLPEVGMLPVKALLPP